MKTIEYPPDKISLKESERIMKAHPGRIPVIVVKLHNNLDMKKTKYLVPNDLHAGQLQYVFRKGLNVSQTESIFMYINDKILPCSSDCVTNLYEQYNVDGFLKITIARENTFG